MEVKLAPGFNLGDGVRRVPAVVMGIGEWAQLRGGWGREMLDSGLMCYA